MFSKSSKTHDRKSERVEHTSVKESGSILRHTYRCYKQVTHFERADPNFLKKILMQKRTICMH